MTSSFQATTRILTRKRIGPFFTYSPWDLVSEQCVFGHRKRRIRLNGRPTAEDFCVFTKISVPCGRPFSQALSSAYGNGTYMFNDKQLKNKDYSWWLKRRNCTCRAGCTECRRVRQQTPIAHFGSTLSTASKDVTMNIMMGNPQPTKSSDKVFLALRQYWTVASHHSNMSNAGIEMCLKPSMCLLG